MLHLARVETNADSKMTKGQRILERCSSRGTNAGGFLSDS